MTQIDPRALRHAFGTFMTGVTVVTTRNAAGDPLGFTANSFTSVSLDPPLVLVCLANSSSNYQAFSNGRGFAVNILSEGQKDVSNTFARPSQDRFATVGWQDGPHGNPIIEGVSAWFDCSLFRTVEAGDHVILLGRIEGFDANPTPGLGYARGAYVTPAAEVEALAQSADLVLSALITHDGQVLLVEGQDGARSLPQMRVGKAGVAETLGRLLQQTGLNAEPGFIYSVYDDTARKCQQITFLCDAAPCEAAGGAPADGSFTAITPETLATIADPAMRTMLARFAEESRIGNFGIYYGNENSGQVRSIATRS